MTIKISRKEKKPGKNHDIVWVPLQVSLKDDGEPDNNSQTQ
jgi:hypothetical protein